MNSTLQAAVDIAVLVEENRRLREVLRRINTAALNAAKYADVNLDPLGIDRLVQAALDGDE